MLQTTASCEGGRWTRPAGGGREKMSARRFQSRRRGNKSAAVLGVERLKSKSRVAEEGKPRQEGESNDLGIPVELQWRDGMESGVCCWSCRTLWRGRVYCRRQGFSYRTFDKERGTTCEPRSESTRSTLITQRQSENHQLILKTGLATLGRLPLTNGCEMRREEGEEVEKMQG